MKKLIAIVAATMLAFTCGMAFAKPGGKATTSKSASHISEKGKDNTNGINATDKDKGQDRAADRKNASALSHEQVGKHGKAHTK